jgi:chromosome segregation ATPase
MCALGCSSKQSGVVVESAASETGYASRYPEELAKTRNDFLTQESGARTLMQNMANYPGELDETDFARVKEVYSAADAAGRGGSYVARARENRSVESFFEAEKGEISKKVAGAANYAASQKGCKAEVYGPASHALEKSVEKQLEERLRAHNEAHGIIDANEDALGKPNREKLEKHADEIAYASYLVRVATQESKADLERKIEEAKDVRSTLDRVIQEADAVEADAGRKEGDKQKAKERKERAAKAKEQIDVEVKAADELIKDLEKRIKTLGEEYEKALSDLLAAVDAKASQGGGA